MIVDANKLMDIYPSLGMLSKIRTESYSVGGSACNTSIDLKAIDNEIAVSVIGRIGNDDKGKFILKEYKKFHIDTSKVIIDTEHATSYTDCMVDAQGRRTFFQYGGANDYRKIIQIRRPGHCHHSFTRNGNHKKKEIGRASCRERV